MHCGTGKADKGAAGRGKSKDTSVSSSKKAGTLVRHSELLLVFEDSRAPTCQHEPSTHAFAVFLSAAVPGSHTLDAHCTMSCPAEQNSGKITSYVNYVLANARGVLILPCCFQCLDVQEGEGSGECPLFLCQLHRCLALNCGWECMSCESSSFVVLGSA